MTAVPRPPTSQQRRVLAAIVAHWRDHSRSPTVRELMPAVPTTTTNGVTGHLKALAAKGLIEWPGGGARGIWPAGLRGRIAALLAEGHAKETTCERS